MRTLLLAMALTAPFLHPLPAASPGGPSPLKVMLIGDSLSVGGFGDGMQAALIRKFGAQNVAVFASCGSSPEDWLKGDYVTHCGYRQTTPEGNLLYKYDNGKRPRGVRTPKLRRVLGHYRPEFVIVQLGTNWMDALAEARQPDAGRYGKIIDEFVRELRRGNPAVSVFWVLPPSSSKYAPEIHAKVEGWINEVSRSLGFFTINSRSITGRYRAGQSGGDGVHYTDAAGRAWARGVYAKFADAVKTLSLAPPAIGP